MIQRNVVIPGELKDDQETLISCIDNQSFTVKLILEKEKQGSNQFVVVVKCFSPAL